MTQPVGSGAPAPVQGVTGGPGLPSGVAGVEGGTGNVVITPPSNTFQLRKGDSPQALQVYEFYHSATDNVRIELLTAVGGPEVIGVRAAPAGTTRDLQIVTSGNGRVTIPALQLPYSQALITSLSVSSAVQTTLSTWGSFVNPQPTVIVATAAGITPQVTGVYLIVLWQEFGPSAGGSRRDIRALVGGAGTREYLQALPVNAGLGATGNLVILMSVTAGTLITSTVYQDSGAALSLNADLSVFKVG